MYLNFGLLKSRFRLTDLGSWEHLSIPRNTNYNPLIFLLIHCYHFGNLQSVTLVKALEKVMDDIRLLSRKQLEELLSWSKSSIYAKMERDEFPKPIHFGRTVRWRYIDIQDFVKNGGIK